MIRRCHDAAERDVRLGPYGAIAHKHRGELLVQILTLQSSLAEQEKTISKLREEVKEARLEWQPIETAPHSGRHLFFLDWANDCVKLNPPLAEDNPERTVFGRYGEWSSVYRATHWLAVPAIRSLKSQDSEK